MRKESKHKEQCDEQRRKYINHKHIYQGLQSREQNVWSSDYVDIQKVEPNKSFDIFW